MLITVEDDEAARYELPQTDDGDVIYSDTYWQVAGTMLADNLQVEVRPIDLSQLKRWK